MLSSPQVIARLRRKRGKERVDRHLEDHFKGDRMPQSRQPYASFIVAQETGRFQSHEVGHMLQGQASFLPFQSERIRKFFLISTCFRHRIAGCPYHLVRTKALARLIIRMVLVGIETLLAEPGAKER